MNINYRYRASELEYVLEDSRAKVIVFHSRFARLLEEVLPGLTAAPTLVQIVDDSGAQLLEGATWFEDALAERRPVERTRIAALAARRSPDDLYICYTGGTTGMPKGVLWRQADFLVAALGVRGRDERDIESLSQLAAAAADSRLRALPAPPLMHGAAHWNAFSCWLAGGTVLIQSRPDRFDAGDILGTVERERATSLLIVGDSFARPLVDELDRRSYDLGSMRHLLSGGAILSPHMKAALLERLPGVTIVDVLGSSESGRQGVAQSSRADTSTASFEPSATAAVLDDAITRRLEPGDAAIGWLAQTGRVPLGYLGDPDKTARTFPVIDGVRHAVAGDRARVLADGSIELLGRDSVCINTGGEKVFAEEVEVALTSHPAVHDAVVCGRPSERWGSEIVGVVALRSEGTVGDAELIDWCRQRLASFKAPKAIVRVESVVRSPSGKADYRWAAATAVGTTPEPRSD